MTPTIIPLRRQILKGIFATTIMGAFAWGMARYAMTTDRGVVINRIIRLDRDEAAMLMASFAVFSAAFALLCLVALVLAISGGQRRIEISREHLSLPRPMNLGYRAIPLHSIQALRVKQANGMTSLEIVHAQGKSAIDASWLGRGHNLQSVATLIRTAVQKARLTAEHAALAEQGQADMPRVFGRRVAVPKVSA